MIRRIWHVAIVLLILGAHMALGANLPTSCVDILAVNPGAPDGTYWIFPNGVAFQVYCNRMATATPVEYLTLVNTGPGLNYSRYTAGGASPGTNVVSSYTKVRLDPATLLVNVGDQMFATSTGSLLHGGTTSVTSMPYGTAMACLGASDQAGSANIDLRGTPFAVTGSFFPRGFQAAGTAAFTSANQMVNLTGGGFCGSESSDPNASNPFNTNGTFTLQLGFIGPTSSPATHFVISAPTSATPGVPFHFTVAALYSNNVVATSYAGTVHFTSSDPLTALPPDTVLTHGVGTFSATFGTVGRQTITGMDTAAVSISGTSDAITSSFGGYLSAVGVNPAAGNGAAQVFTFQFGDPLGWQDLSVVNVLINGALDGRNACYLAYSQPSNVVYLVNDQGTALLPGLLLNGSGTLSNGQCTVYGAGTSVSSSGSTLALTLDLAFSPSFGGNKVIYLAARDAAQNNTGWQALGTWLVPGAAPTVITAVGINPARGMGSNQTFTATFTDSKGWQDIGVVNILINSSLDGRQSCYLAYSRPSNVLYLVNDSGTALLPGLILNGSGSVGNSQCTVNGVGSSVDGGGNTLVLMLNIGFTAAFQGNRLIYMAARDTADGNSTGWQAMGSWTVQ